MNMTLNSEIFSKEDTLALKGIAIQVMVFLHLFISSDTNFKTLILVNIGGVKVLNIN